MADKLCGHRFEELGPEFDAVEHLARAAQALSSSSTSTGARARQKLDEVRRALHPAALDPECHTELAQKRARRASQQVVQAPPAAALTAGPDPREAQVLALNRRLAEVEARNKALAAELADKPATDATTTTTTTEPERA